METTLKTAPTDALDEIRALAAELDCFLDEDIQRIAGVTSGTTDAWRRRGKGPPYLVFGNRTLYPRKPAVEYIQTLIRERQRVSVADAL